MQRVEGRQNILGFCTVKRQINIDMTRKEH